MFTIVSGRTDCVPFNYPNVSRVELEYLDPCGWKTNCFTVAHAREPLAFAGGSSTLVKIGYHNSDLQLLRRRLLAMTERLT